MENVQSSTVIGCDVGGLVSKRDNEILHNINLAFPIAEFRAKINLNKEHCIEAIPILT
jgi:hypothetical protein